MSKHAGIRRTSRIVLHAASRTSAPRIAGSVPLHRREAGMYGTARNRASPTWGRIKKELRCVSANCAKMDAFSAAVPQRRHSRSSSATLPTNCRPRSPPGWATVPNGSWPWPVFRPLDRPPTVIRPNRLAALCPKRKCPVKTHTCPYCMQGRRGETRSRCRGRRKGAGEIAHAPRPLVFGGPEVAECLRGRVAIEPRAPAFEPAPDADIVAGAGKVAHDKGEEVKPGGDRVVAAEPPLPLRSLARYRRVPASGPGTQALRRVEGSAPRTKHVGGRHGQDRHVTLRCRRLSAHA